MNDKQAIQTLSNFLATLIRLEHNGRAEFPIAELEASGRSGQALTMRQQDGDLIAELVESPRGLNGCGEITIEEIEAGEVKPEEPKANPFPGINIGEARKMTKEITAALTALDAKSAERLLSALILSPIVTALPEAKWREMVRCAGIPCARPGCDCHVPAREVFRALDHLRRNSLEDMGGSASMIIIPRGGG